MVLLQNKANNAKIALHLGITESIISGPNNTTKCDIFEI